jgi:predicted house-cleaning noncanonical NTP pyrophosphatase (MazG superfamily)
LSIIPGLVRQQGAFIINNNNNNNSITFASKNNIILQLRVILSNEASEFESFFRFSEWQVNIFQNFQQIQK